MRHCRHLPLRPLHRLLHIHKRHHDGHGVVQAVGLAERLWRLHKLLLRLCLWPRVLLQDVGLPAAQVLLQRVEPLRLLHRHDILRRHRHRQHRLQRLHPHRPPGAPHPPHLPRLQDPPRLPHLQGRQGPPGDHLDPRRLAPRHRQPLLHARPPLLHLRRAGRAALRQHLRRRGAGAVGHARHEVPPDGRGGPAGQPRQLPHRPPGPPHPLPRLDRRRLGGRALGVPAGAAGAQRVAGPVDDLHRHAGAGPWAAGRGARRLYPLL
mmetsp:Transcript_8356/g.20499  ORF Transcript_8356/g.20499 Transcript_8356/m.20499 type:complete len:264 (-) Transcript_8356:791-1582(-)